MGYITFYRCLISRDYEAIEKFKHIVDKNYFAHYLYTAAQTAALNGMSTKELESVLQRFLGEDYANRLHQYMEGVTL